MRDYGDLACDPAIENQTEIQMGNACFGHDLSQMPTQREMRDYYIRIHAARTCTQPSYAYQRPYCTRPYMQPSHYHGMNKWCLRSPRASSGSSASNTPQVQMVGRTSTVVITTSTSPVVGHCRTRIRKEANRQCNYNQTTVSTASVSNAPPQQRPFIGD